MGLQAENVVGVANLVMKTGGREVELEVVTTVATAFAEGEYRDLWKLTLPPSTHSKVGSPTSLLLPLAPEPSADQQLGLVAHLRTAFQQPWRRFGLSKSLKW